ncbi:MAG: SDR family oxidoreductase, partial [Acidimicrobiia bacterium]
GYTEVVHCLVDRFTENAAVVMFGGLAKDRPYVGSTTVTTVNGAVTTMINTMALELAPIRFNAIHPAVVGDSPYWVDKPAEVLEGIRSRTPTGRLVTTAEVVGAVVFLLENGSVNDVNLRVDGGSLIM